MKSLLFFLTLILVGVYFYSFNFFITLFVLSFLIFFHELGHFLVAKALKVEVEVFSIGFGKALFEYKFKNTAYRLSALPLGGYVKLKGQNDLKPAEELSEKGSYSALKPLEKIYILSAGSLFNILLAFLLYISIAFMGVNKLLPEIGHIEANSAAEDAGLKKGDVIKSINGENILSFDQIKEKVGFEKLNLQIQRGGELLQIQITPKLGQSYNDFLQEIQKPVIGIAPSGNTALFHYKGLSAFEYAYKESFNALNLVVKGLTKLILGEIDPKNLGGIITIVDFTSKASQTSLVSLFLISALISINLGVLNLLPIPMLDGGHIVFNLYELITKRKVNAKLFEFLSYLGVALLLTLILYASYNDIMRLSTNP